MTICCLNPDCRKPQNDDGTKHCTSCGTPITILRNHYRPLKLLSDEGGFGRTYLAEDLDRLKALCVIKQLCPQKQGTAALAKVQDLFEGEAKQMQQLEEHPQIPQLLAYFQEKDYLYLVQQYIKGQTLDKLRNRCWTEKEVRDFLENILPVFEFIHQRQVIHRDIKPSSIIQRDDDKQYVLIDFGASKDFAATIATRGTIIGTQGYAAYEQMLLGEAFNTSDLYSLGATCFFLLTGTDPYHLLLEQGYQWVKHWQTYLKQPLSEQLKQVLGKLLEKERQNRYQSAIEVLAVLQTQAPQKQSRLQPRQPKPIQPTFTASPWRKNKALETFIFETVQVDHQGNVIKRERKQGEQFTITLGNDVSLDLVKISGGTFIMGSPEGEGSEREKPQHKVIVPSFFISKFQVTQAQWRAIASLPQVKRYLNPDPSKFKGDDRPVEQVSWYDAVEFCQRLSKQTGREYRLPSEAEWEYACRAGTTTPFYFGETITTELANYNGDYTYASGPKGEYRRETNPVGSFPPNAFGLYDMHGNVWEWCEDDWHDSYNGASTDGSAWLSGTLILQVLCLIPKVLRGGSWVDPPRDCRSAYRFGFFPDYGYINFGFRVAWVAARTP